jgi:acetyl-CoA carboxylase carboxyltransferase component
VSAVPELSETGARRLEVPVLVDRRGTVWAPGVLDVSLRFHDRTVLAESPPPDFSPEQAQALCAVAARLAGARATAGAATVSFLTEAAGGEPRFTGTVAGLPAAAALLESTTELDLADLEIYLARGGTLDGKPPESRGHALQIQLSARDPEDGFTPAAGVVETLRLPSGAGVRADAGVELGERPGAELLLARLTAHGRTRPQALARLQQALARTEAVVGGGTSDKAFLTALLDRPEIAREAGQEPPAPGWIERLVAHGEHLPRRGAEAALLAASVAAAAAELERARARFFTSAARGRPEVPREIVRLVELRHRGHLYAFRISPLERDLYRVEVDGLCFPVRAGMAVGGGLRTLACGERSWRVALTPQGGRQIVEVDGVPHFVEHDEGGMVRSPAPAVVVALTVQEGDEVAAGDPLAVLEAMKMETTLLAEAAGRVRKVLVRRNAQVAAGAALLVIEPPAPGRRAAASDEARVRFAALAALADGAAGDDTDAAETDAEGCSPPLQETLRLVLGYDADPHAVQRLVSGPAAAGTPSPAERRLEDGILRAFVDIGALFRRHPAHGAEEYLFSYLRGDLRDGLRDGLRDLGPQGTSLPASFLAKLRRALTHYGVDSLERTAALEESLFRIAVSHQRQAQQVPAVLAVLERLLGRGDDDGAELRDLLDRLIAETQDGEPALHDLAREVRYRRFDRPLLLAARERIYAAAEVDIAHLAAALPAAERAERIRALVELPQSLHRVLSRRYAAAGPALREAILEVMVRRYYRIRELGAVAFTTAGGQDFAIAEYDYQGSHVHLFATHAPFPQMAAALGRAVHLAAGAAPESEAVVDLYLWQDSAGEAEDATAERIAALLAAPDLPSPLRRVAVTVAGDDSLQNYTFRRTAGGADGGEDAPEPFVEDRVYRGIHPLMALRLQLWRFQAFDLARLPAPEGVYFFHGVARENRKDERLFAIAEVRDLTPVRDEAGRVVQLPQLERLLMEALAGIRRFQARRAAGARLHWNRVLLYVWPPVDLHSDELNGLVHRLAPLTVGLGLEKVAVRGRIPDPQTGTLQDWVLEISNPGEGGMVLRFRKPSEAPLKPLREYAQKVVDLRRRGLPHPYELVKQLAPPARDAQTDLPAGEFVEHDLDSKGDRLVPVARPYGANTANVVTGVVRNFTPRCPEGMTRVIVLGDPSRGMGALAEPECRRILAALDLAAELGVPLEWFALSAGAKIAMDSGTENMDWIARVLRRLITFTQAGGEVNVVVCGINVGAQPYWNAEATMLMHTRGILIMTPDGAMVLTGKQALDYSGGVSAEDNLGIGGYERIMGPNGQAQYFARDLGEACLLLLAHYEHTWVAPGERFPRPTPTRDPRDRDVCDFPHGGAFRTVGEVFSPATNPGRKKPFEIRRVMAAVVDQDHEPLERWYGMRDAEIGVVWDAHLGGHSVCLLGFESKPLPRLGWVPAYGPDQWTGGTLFPQSSKKIARAINAASGNRPLVVLANLSGFDGSPESMRLGQLEYGAEIGRAVVSFRGPIVFCVVARYHGGAFVVFSGALHDNMEVAALEGTYASVIGGAPAAAVVFAREVDKRTRADPRVAALEKALADPERTDKAHLAVQLAETTDLVRSEKLGEVAEEFDRVHSVQRAQQVGSVHRIIAPAALRPYLIDAVERGMAKELGGLPAEGTLHPVEAP